MFDITVAKISFRRRRWIAFPNRLLRSCLSVTSWYELVEFCDLVVGHAGKDIGEPGLGLGNFSRSRGGCSGNGFREGRLRLCDLTVELLASAPSAAALSFRCRKGSTYTKVR
jgi:hypothetical protein